MKKTISAPVALRACAICAIAISPFSLMYSPFSTGLLLLAAGFLVQVAEKVAVAAKAKEVNHA